MASPGRPSARWTLQLPKDLPAVRTARAAVERTLEGAGEQLIDDARSAVTELVSNAVRYGRPPITLSVAFDDGELRVEVQDGGAGAWAARSPDENGGWGLRIVGRLADRWGVDEASSRVWCVLRAAQPKSVRPAKRRSTSGRVSS